MTFCVSFVNICKYVLLIQQDGFFMVVSDDDSGCHPCGCSLSTAVSLLCNNTSGQCPCKSHLIGRICDVIEDFYWLPYFEGVIYEAEFASLSVSY